MTFWQSLVSKFGVRAKSLDAQIALTEAYRRLFMGSPSRQDQEMVLADLFARSGTNHFTAPSGVASSEQLWFKEGRRSYWLELFGHLLLNDGDMLALQQAARREQAFAEQQT